MGTRAHFNASRHSHAHTDAWGPGLTSMLLGTHMLTLMRGTRAHFDASRHSQAHTDAWGPGLTSMLLGTHMLILMHGDQGSLRCF